MQPNDPVQEEIARIRKLLESNLMNLVDERLADLVKQNPDNQDVALLQADCLMEWSDYRRSKAIIDKWLQADPQNLQLLRGLVKCCGGLAEADLLLEATERFQKLRPGHPDALGASTDALERAGRVDEAEEMLGRLETCAMPVGELVKKLRIPYLRTRIKMARKDYQGAIETLRETFAQVPEDSLTSNMDAQYIECLFLLAKCNNKIGDYDGAWEASEKAHRIDGRKHKPEIYEKSLEDMRRVFTPEMAGKLARADAIDLEPLIILGNPRSGTTLLDTILGMHDEVAQGGELSAGRFVQQALPRLTDSYLQFPMSLIDVTVEDANGLGRVYEECTAGIADGQRYLSNKALSMHVQLGMLAMAMPKMRVIDLHRHPLDNCVSCYTMNLLVSGHVYTNSLEDLGRIWVARRKMQEYWPQVLDVPFLKVNYEDMVSDQENQTRRILDFLDVPFDDACLNFHEAEKTAATLSYDQVSQKMYTTSKGRWRNYEKHLGPLIDIVEPYL